MKKTMLTIFTVTSLVYLINDAFAFIKYEDKQPKRVTEIHMTGYSDYAPFGRVDNPGEVMYGKFNTVFQPMLDKFIKDANLDLKFDLMTDKDKSIDKIRKGETDFYLGAYYKTEFFKGLHLLYPAPLSNPVTVFMLPNKINKVKTVDDIKKLKGVRNQNEIFNDFIENKLTDFNLLNVNSSYEMFEKLFNREVDYILCGYYYGILEATRLGLKHQIAPAKQSLWNIPVFIGISKTSRNREMITRYLIRYLNDENMVKALNDNVKKIVKEYELKYLGVVPPSFGMENKDFNKTDEALPSSVTEDAAKDNKPASSLPQPSALSADNENIKKDNSNLDDK